MSSFVGLLDRLDFVLETGKVDYTYFFQTKIV